LQPWLDRQTHDQEVGAMWYATPPCEVTAPPLSSQHVHLLYSSTRRKFFKACPCASRCVNVELFVPCSLRRTVQRAVLPLCTHLHGEGRCPLPAGTFKRTANQRPSCTKRSGAPKHHPLGRKQPAKYCVITVPLTTQLPPCHSQTSSTQHAMPSNKTSPFRSVKLAR